jgi:hypothetical protein
MTRPHANDEREFGNANSPFGAGTGPPDQDRELDESDIATLIAFFRLLDRWDREATRNAETM